MDGMPKGQHEAAGAGMRRARTCAWIVTVIMGGTTMSFQVYHAVKRGHMPWELAVLYGVVPLLIALLVLEIVAEWREAPWAAKAAAYLIMGAAMFLSASATGAVVLHVAPGHFSLLPGALLDAAELFAAFFIMNGPTAAQAVAKIERIIGELTAEANAERSARLEAEANAGRTERGLREANAAGLGAERQGARRALAAVTGELEEARESERGEANARRAAEAELGAVRVKLAAAAAGKEGAQAGWRAAKPARDEALARTERQVESLRAQLDAARQAAAMTRAAEAERNAALAELGTVRTERDDAVSAREEAERSAANAAAKAERLARKAGAQDAPRAGRSARTDGANAARAEGALTPAQAREKAYAMLDKNPDLTGAEVGEPFGFGDRWGQKRKEEYEHRNGLRAVGDG